VNVTSALAVLPTVFLAAMLIESTSGAESADGTRLAIQGTRFALNGRPTFLLGASYYGALGAAEETIRRDLDAMQARGFNWIRVWATWSAFGSDVSAVDGDGNARQPHLNKLRRLVAECDRRGMVVDVTLSRGNGVTGPSRLQSLAAHRRVVDTLVEALKSQCNWYLDLANERNIRDRRYASVADLRELRAAVRRLDPERLVIASHAGDISREELREYLRTVEVDFVSPHRPRHAKSPGQTAKTTRQLRAWMKELNREVPVHYQEPFRRGFSAHWEPSAEDFATDLRQAVSSGAAGWCFHNGDRRDRADGRPRRSFDLRDQGLFEQLDDEEKSFLDRKLADAKASAGD
jgi:endo-1,4-beta-mannosidase